MNKAVSLGFWSLELSKISMYQFFYDSVKPTYREKTKLCFMDTESLYT